MGVLEIFALQKGQIFGANLYTKTKEEPLPLGNTFFRGMKLVHNDAQRLKFTNQQWPVMVHLC